MTEPSTDIVGRTVKSVRVAIGWTQRQLALRAGVSQAWVCEVENGQVGGLTLVSADRLLRAMGARLVIGVEKPYLGDRDRQREPAHARCSAHVVRQLRRSGWEVASEVEVGGDRSRGWIDVLAWHPATGVLLVIEIKTEIHDLGAIERTLGWYEREAWAAARRLGWRPRRVLGCLLLLATEANDARALANRVPLAEGFPGRAKDLLSVLGGDPRVFDRVLSARDRAIAMIDPLSRRQAWVRPLRIDGRRSAAPYPDYAGFMRVIVRGRRGPAGPSPRPV